MYNTFIKNYEKYQEIVPDYEDLLVAEWNNGLSHPYKIGKLTALWKQYGKPTDYRDFYDSYSTYYGLGQLVDSTKKLSARTGVDLDICYGWVFYKSIIGATKGDRMEEKALQYVNNSGKYTATDTPYSVDTTDGIDMFIYQNGKLSFGVQIKPLSYFLKNSLQPTREDLYKKLEKSEKKYGIKCYYMIYDRNEEWLKNGNYTVWEFRSLTDEKGNVK